jgi:arginase
LRRKDFAVIDAPSVLGLRPTGVELLADALKAAGLIEKLHAEYIGKIMPYSSYNYERDRVTGLLNPLAIKYFSLRLAGVVRDVLCRNKFPIVLGGDCSILIGNVLALKQLSRYGLFFIDGHADFYKPEQSPTGEVADMDLRIVSGHGPDILSNLNGLKPLILEQDIVVFGYRDGEQSASYGCEDIKKVTRMLAVDLLDIRNMGLKNAANLAIDKVLSKNEISGFWIHLDADVLDDSIMPAVDYRIPGGITYSELTDLLKLLLATNLATGMSITIFNPLLDKEGSIIRNFVSSIVNGFSSDS